MVAGIFFYLCCIRSSYVLQTLGGEYVDVHSTRNYRIEKLSRGRENKMSNEEVDSDVRKSLMSQFNLDESLAQPSPLEDVDTTTTSGVEEAQATPAQAPTGEEMYDTKGDSPTVNEMLQEVIEYEDLGEVDDGIREQLNKTHIDEDLIEDILGM